MAKKKKGFGRFIEQLTNPMTILGGGLGFSALGGAGLAPGLALGNQAAKAMELELPEALPTLVDEEAINQEAEAIIQEEKDRRKAQPGLRNQTVLTSSRAQRPSLLSR